MADRPGERAADHRGAFGEHGGESGAFIERTFRERIVVTRYAMRNALAPSVQVFAQNIQYLIGGIIVVEYLFAYSGIGKELVDSVAVRDVRAVQSIAVLLAAIYIVINILADLIVVLLTPKLRTQA